MFGRFAPSPSGEMHLGNLRTALLAWLFARSSGRQFLIRFEDLDRERTRSDHRILEDLAALGIDWDQPPQYQSERLPLYEAALARLTAAGLTYECFCSRKDVVQAASAPHALPGHYPGTCRNLNSAQREARRRSRPPALRLRADVDWFEVQDELHGKVRGAVDDFVLQRSDRTPAYNLAVVVDDHEQNIDQVVRGDDLLSSAGRQGYLGSLLGYAVPSFAHVPLALGPTGARLAKRDGAVTLSELAAIAVEPTQVLRTLLDSLNIQAESLPQALAHFNPGTLPLQPWSAPTWA